MSAVGVLASKCVRWLLVGASVLAGAVGLTAGSAASRAAASGRVGTIAFIRMADERVFGGRLFVIRPDGSGLRALTAPGTVEAYAWSPGGSSIAYIDQHLSLWLVRPDGTGRRLLLSTSRLSSIGLSWSPDGKEIAIAAAGVNVNPRTVSCASRLYVVPVDGGQPLSLHTRAGCDVAWSPRGDQIAYGRGGGIFVMRADGTGSRQVASGGGPHWSEDGVQLAFGVAIHRRSRGFTLGDRYTAFGVVDADGKGFHVVTTHAYTEYAVAWSPTGRRILYGRADSKGIYVIDADSQDNHRITRDSPPEADWGALAWSPTGGSIVYTTGPADKTNLYVIGADGRDKHQLTNTPDIDIDPSWSAQ